MTEQRRGVLAGLRTERICLNIVGETPNKLINRFRMGSIFRIPRTKEGDSGGGRGKSSRNSM